MYEKFLKYYQIKSLGFWQNEPIGSWFCIIGVGLDHACSCCVLYNSLTKGLANLTFWSKLPHKLTRRVIIIFLPLYSFKWVNCGEAMMNIER